MGRALCLLLVFVLAGCAQFSQLVKTTRAHVTLVEGLRQFDAGEHDASAKTLQRALDIGPGGKDRATAHKHLAFIHCTAGRERQCRDEFRKGLAADPRMQLDAAEDGHPAWGPVFRSMNGPGALSTGLKQYEQGNYAESVKNLQGAIELGVSDKQRANAHKHLAFIHCSWNQERECREEFRKALAVDPRFDLAPAEAGHPVWGPLFRSLKAGR